MNKVKVTGQIICMSGKPLSQGTYMPNIKDLSQTVQKLWPMLKLSKQQTNQQTNKPTNQQTDRAKAICPRYRYRAHKKKLKCRTSWAWLASFSQLVLISDPHIDFQKSRNGLTDLKGPEDIEHTKVKYAEMFYGRHTAALTSLVVKTNIQKGRDVTQLSHSVVTTSLQRRRDVMTSRRRCNDVLCLLG